MSTQALNARQVPIHSAIIENINHMGWEGSTSHDVSLCRLSMGTLEVYLETKMQFQADETDAVTEYLCSLKLLTVDLNGDGYEKLFVNPSLQKYLERQLQDSEHLKTRA